MNQSTPSLQTHHDADEIDLFELFESLWQQKWIIVAITSVVTCIAVAYALIATPVYQTSSILKPALIKDMDELSTNDVYPLSPESALTLVGNNLESYNTRFEYFKRHLELFEEYIQSDESLEQNFERFNREAVTVLRPDDKKNESFSKYFGIQIDYPKGVDGPAIANGFVRYAIDLARTHLLEDVNTLIENRINEVEKQLNTIRSSYITTKEARIEVLLEESKLKKLNLNDELEALRISLKNGRENRIKQLTEAITIAQSLGIKKPTTPSGLNTGIHTAGSVIKAEIYNQEIPLYFMGTDALQAERTTLMAREDDDFTSARIVDIKNELKRLENNREIEILKSRDNEDLFLKDLAEKHGEITRLKGLHIDMDRIQLVTLDKRAIQPSIPIKPNKKLIVLIGALLGGMLGVFVALMLSMVRKRKAHL